MKLKTDLLKVVEDELHVEVTKHIYVHSTEELKEAIDNLDYYQTLEFWVGDVLEDTEIQVKISNDQYEEPFRVEIIGPKIKPIDERFYRPLWEELQKIEIEEKE